MKLGDRVRIIGLKTAHPWLSAIHGAEGAITLVEPPFSDADPRIRYEVSWDEPRGPRGYIAHFPLFETDLELIDAQP